MPIASRKIWFDMKEIYGGNIKDYPKARRRFGPKSKAKRRVELSIHRYYGVGKHYWVSLSEESNSLWDAKEKAWRQCWDDDKGKGRFSNYQATSIASAKLWAVGEIKQKFKKHTVSNGHTRLDSDIEERLWRS